MFEFLSLGVFNLIFIFILLGILIVLVIKTDGLLRWLALIGVFTLIAMLFIFPIIYDMVNLFFLAGNIGVMGVLLVWAILAIIPPYISEEGIISIPLMILGVPILWAEAIALGIAFSILIFFSISMPMIWGLLWTMLSKLSFWDIIIFIIYTIAFFAISIFAISQAKEK